LKQVSHPAPINIFYRHSDHGMTHFIFIFRSRTLLTAYSPLLLISPMMKARKRAPPGQSGSHRQRSEPSWKNYRLSFIRIRHNWSMTPTQPRFYLGLLEARFQPMLKKSSSKPHIWRVVSCSTRGLLGALPIELLRPSFLKR